jgi:demethylsterigmatocystin 6-O-methyltransferase
VACQAKNQVSLIISPDAKFYNLSAVLHDFPDAKCQEILRNILPAMGDDSAILIDEMVFLESNLQWAAA